MWIKQKLNPLSWWFDMVNSTWTNPWDAVVLDNNWKIPVSTIPATAITERFVAANQAEMLALDAQIWDICARTDENKIYQLMNTDPSVLANWIVTNVVSSVNNQTWDVVVNDVKIWSTAPTNPTEWMVWYDTANDLFKTYNWVGWDIPWQTLKSFPVEFNTTWTTAQFLSSITALNLPVGMSYLWQVSLSDMPDWITVQAEVQVDIYPQNVVYATMRSAEVSPYEWMVNSYDNRWREPVDKTAKDYTDSRISRWTTAPSNPTEWQLWYDTTNDVLKMYNWNTWDIAQKEINVNNKLDADSVDDTNSTNKFVTDLEKSTWNWKWDMKYVDYNFATLSWASVTLSLCSKITPSADFTVNAPATIKDWQTYLLRVENWATAYTMTLGTWITNPDSADLTLEANKVNQFVFLATGWNLELQKPAEGWTWDVTWPSNSTDEDIVLFNWVWWKIIKDSGKKISDLVQTSGNQTINGVKTFAFDPVLPSKTTDATNDWTKPATEAQVYKKQEKIDSNNKLNADVVSNGTNNRICIVSSSAPSTPSQWDLWYDTTSDKLKSYNWTNWNESWWWTSPSAASSTTAWVLKIADDTVQTEAAQTVSSATNKTYWVQLNSSGQAVVNVPRTNTTYQASDFDIKDLTDSTGLRNKWIKDSDFWINTATTWATLTISNYTTSFTPSENFSIVAWTVKEWMQYIVRLTSWATAYTMTLGTWITNPYGEALTLTANKTTTVVFFATSSSTLELFGIKTEA